MKKHIKKLLQKRKASQDNDNNGRITNETVAEHRERILAGGRKFKYPVQYSKHKLLINTAIISVVVVLLGSLLLWYQLYVAQNTSNLTYRITQLIPLPVAKIEGKYVRYSDYLMKYRSSIHFLEAQDNFSPNTADGQRQADFVKRQQLDTAIKDAYVEKLASEIDVSVSNTEVNEFIAKDLDEKKVSQRAFERTVLADYYGWSMNEYRDVVKMSLLKRKVSFNIDEAAREKAQNVLEQVNDDGNFASIAREESDDNATSSNGGEAGTITADAPDPDGIIEELTKIQEGDTTGLIQGRDGYYIARLDDESGASMRYSIIKISLTELNNRFDELQESDQTEEYIEIEQE